MPKNLNTKYAIVRIKGTQYRVSEGDEILVDKLDAAQFDSEVLLYTDGKSAKVGTPVVPSVSVKFDILKDEEKGDKIRILKYKSKSRYRKHIGFRPVYTRLQVQKIG